MNFKTIKDFDVNGKTVLLRADLNVPVRDGKVTDTTRIDRVKPTIDYLLSQNAKIVILSHYGRPKGQENPDFSLEFLPVELSKQWGTPVGFGENSNEQITLLENLRFNPGEEANDASFAEQLANLGDIYVNDAFSCAHRAHASTEAITHILPSCAGLSMEAELNALNDALEAPETPVMAIVGGAKVSTKLSVLHNLVKKVDFLTLGGGMANTFLLAKGHNMGASLCEKDMVDEANSILKTAEQENCEIILPIDCTAVERLEEGASHTTETAEAFPSDKSAVDVSEQSIAYINEKLNECKTVLWNGPMGVFEIKPFDNGTNKVAQHVAELTKSGKTLSVAGGGDTVAALDNADAIQDFSYISTAGGAFLEWIEGKELPGVKALETSMKKAA